MQHRPGTLVIRDARSGAGTPGEALHLLQTCAASRDACQGGLGGDLGRAPWNEGLSDGPGTEVHKKGRGGCQGSLACSKFLL